jgi:Flp pilus assembly protein TadD
MLALGLVFWPGASLADPSEEDPKEGRLDPDYAAGKAAIAAKDWNGAIRSLSSAALRDTRNADIQNYLGYAYRQGGQLQPAFTHYQKALQLNPRHRGAHEYIGEAYLMANQPDKAEEHAKVLAQLCPSSCEELTDLRAAIVAYKSGTSPRPTAKAP